MENKQKETIEKLKLISGTNERSVFLNKDISGIKLINLRLNGQLFRRCNFYGTEFYNVAFQNCEILGCDFSKTKLFDVSFINCKLIDCNFNNAKMQDVTVEGGFKSNCTFEDIELINNVKGIDSSDANIISDAIEKTTILNKLNELYPDFSFINENNSYKLNVNGIDIVIGKDEGKTWRIMLGKETGQNIEDYESLSSSTIDENITKDELYNEIIMTIESALKYAESSHPDMVNDIQIILKLFKNVNLINENSELISERSNGKWIELTEDNIDLFEQIDSALNHVTNNMLDDMVLGEIQNLLIKYNIFMNNKVRD